jgi:hypothetical protein
MGFWARRRNVRRSDESCVKQHGADRDPDRASRGSESREPASRRGCGDSGHDQAVPEWAAFEGTQRDDDDRERAGDVGDDRQQPRGDEVEVVLSRRDAVRRERAVYRHRECDADGETGVDEHHRRGSAAPARRSEPAPSKGAVRSAPAA